MPVFAAPSAYRRRIFRIVITLFIWGFLLSTFLFVTSFLIPEQRTPIAHEEAFSAYEYYYSADTQKKIALTFDDGPNKEATVAIAQTLKEYQVPATFFFVGGNILTNPEVAQYVAQEGFEVGNHSYSHSFEVHQSPERLAMELAATTRLIERTTGKRPTFYRPPFLFGIGVDPAPNPWVPAVDDNRWVLALGYLPVGIDVDSLDWAAQTPEEVIEVFNQNLREDRHIALFHDTPQTAEAIKIIIPALIAQGYSIVPLEEVLTPPALRGAYSAKSIIPPPLEPLEVAYMYFLAHAKDVLAVLGVAAFGFLLLRTGVIAFLLHRKNKQPEPRLKRYPLVSVLIPAYNEEENIESTVRSILQNSYPRREIIVIDDGSTDRTAQKVKKLAEGLPHGMVRLLSLENGGKARALTIGARSARGEVLVVLDADAVLKNGAIHAFVKHFGNPKVGAVAGKVYTTNLKGLLNRFQALEYCIGQNLEKRAFSALGAVGVVPGPAGAWRTKAVLDAGGFPLDTLVEDQDMTLILMRRGWQIVYEPNAIAYTETPATLNTFLKQRFRWVYGMLQCFWKHAGVMGSQPRLPMSYLLLPHTLIYGIVLPVSYMVVDTLLVIGFFFGISLHALLSILLFTLVDMLYALWGLRGERLLSKLWWVVPLQRVVYRQLIYYTILRSIVRALEGRGAGWNKFVKLGDTSRFYEESLTPSPIQSLPVNTGGSYTVAPRPSGNVSLIYKAPAGDGVRAHS